MPEQAKKSNMNKGKTEKKGRKGGISGIAAPATGAVIGAAIGGVAGSMLSSREGKKVLGTVADSVKEIAEDTIEAVEENRTQVEKTANSITSSVAEKSSGKSGK